MLIRAWGQIEFDVHSRVDRNGAIYIPRVGTINVAGLRYDQLQGYLKSHIGRIYQNFDLNVGMESWLHRCIRRRPGKSSRALHDQFLEHAGECDLCLGWAFHQRLDAAYRTETRIEHYYYL